MKNLFCKIFGHKLIVVNDIFDRNSPDRLCVRCNAVNFSPAPSQTTWYDENI